MHHRPIGGHGRARRRRRHHRAKHLTALVLAHNASIGAGHLNAGHLNVSQGGLVGADGAALSPAQRQAAMTAGGEYTDHREYTVRIQLSTQAQLVSTMDTTGDGIQDTVYYDASRDGRVDTSGKIAAGADTTGDGVIDSVFIDVTGDGIGDTMVSLSGGAGGAIQLKALSETELQLTLASDRVDKLTFAELIDALETWGDNLAAGQGAAIGAHEADFEVSEISIGGFDTATRASTLAVFKGEEGEEADAAFDKELDVAKLLHPDAGNSTFSIKTTTTVLVLPAALAATMPEYRQRQQSNPMQLQCCVIL